MKQFVDTTGGLWLKGELEDKATGIFTSTATIHGGQETTILTSLVPLIHLAAVLSISIGLLNLFPIPLLDGGHLLFYAIETIRGRPLSERAQELGFRIGLAIVLMLMIFATFNDILHLATS